MGPNPPTLGGPCASGSAIGDGACRLPHLYLKGACNAPALEGGRQSRGNGHGWHARNAHGAFGPPVRATQWAPWRPDTTPHLTIVVRMQRPTAEGSAVISHNHVPMAGSRMHRDAVRCTRKIRALRVCALTTPQPLALWGNGPLAIPYTINLVTFQP